MYAKILTGAIVLALATSCGPYDRAAPIIDVHLHAGRPEEFFAFLGLDAPDECVQPREIPSLDTASTPSTDFAKKYFSERLGTCTTLLKAAATESDLLQRTLAILERRNILAVTSSTFENVQKWKTAAPSHVVPALEVIDPQSFIPDAVREQVAKNQVRVFAEIAPQYLGLSPRDPKLEPIFALAEELDIPVGLHVGLSAPGVPVVTLTGYRAAASRPLELEQVLLKHPRLRLYVMHAGWPMLDETLHLLWSFPQVYVDIAVIDWLLPQQEFHAYLKRLIDAGFAKRIMFGSDNMVWPDAIDVAIDNVNAVPFLTAGQKRDILYNNAARFLRLDVPVASR